MGIPSILYDKKKHADVAWERTDEYSNDFWSTNHLTNAELKAWQKRLTSKFNKKLTWHNRVLDENGAAESLLPGQETV